MARSSFIGLFLALSTFSPAQARDIPLFDHYKGENIPGNHVWAKYAGSCHRWESVCDEKGLSTSHDHKGQMCVSCEVKYLNDNERLPYKLIWQEGKGWLGPDHQPYDTAADVRKRGVHPTEMSDTQTAKEWGAMPGIWVMDTKGNLYTSVEQSPGHFNHSTFLAGGPVVGAGQVIIEKGQITYLNNLSGHYRPTVSDIAGMIDQLHIGKPKLIVAYDIQPDQHPATVSTNNSNAPVNRGGQTSPRPHLTTEHKPVDNHQVIAGHDVHVTQNTPTGHYDLIERTITERRVIEGYDDPFNQN